ncbi:MAG: Zn-dependent alcohol dehydrogenase [Gemmatimonadota bacterium]|nr:Zn-dependent alcohol dehydrogenase [Gemmatimonadota bacterium]
MKAAVLHGPKTPLEIEELDLREPRYGEVLVKMKASGVCHSDWHVIKGDWSHFPFPIVLGHEGAGVVEAIGPGVTHLKEGDHVILVWRTSCGQCEMCQAGRPALCERSPVTGEKARFQGTDTTVHQMVNLGTFSSYAVVPEVALVPISRDIPFPQASLVGCAVMTGVGAVINTANVPPGSSVAIFGAGGVGLNCIQGAVLAGATTIIVVDLLDAKLERARTFGATHTVNASQDDPVEAILTLTDGKGVHYAFEAIGLVEAPFVQSIRCTRRRGMTVWVGHAPADTPVTIDARDLIFEKTVTASMYGSARPQIDFPRLLDLYRTDLLKLDELVTCTFPLEEINEAFYVMGKGEVARSVVVFD